MNTTTYPQQNFELLSEVEVGSIVRLSHAKYNTKVEGEVYELTKGVDGIKSIKVKGIGSLYTRDHWNADDFFIVEAVAFSVSF